MLAITQPGQENPIVYTTPQNRQITTSRAGGGAYKSSGKERLRLKLSPNIDHINKYAVALLEDHEAPSNAENEKWVYLYSERGPVKAVILSIANRLLIPAKDVCMLAAASSDTCIEFNPLCTALEDKIQEIIEKYERKVQSVKSFLKHVLTDEFYDSIQESVLKFIYEDLDNTCDDPEIDAVCKAAEECFLHNDTSGMGKLDICLLVDEFIARLAKIDENYILEAPIYREKITDGSFNSICPLVIENPYVDYPIVGLNLGHEFPAHHGRRYAVKTDGYIYPKKPKMTKELVPFSTDGKNWVLLNIHLLSLYLGLDPKDIRNAAESDDGLNQLLDRQMATLNKGMFRHQFKDNTVLNLDLSLEIYKFLDISDLNALTRINRQYKPDIDLAFLPIARENGYGGCDPVEARKYLKQRFKDLCNEVKMLCKTGIYPRQKIVYDNLIFDRKVMGKKTFRNFKTFKAPELLELFKKDGLYVPFFERISKDFLKKRGGETLFLAAIHGVSEVIIKLVKHGIDVNVRNSKGNSPLHFAAFHGRMEAINLLLEQGAKVNCLNDKGESPLFLACNPKNENIADVMNLLKDYGADYGIKRKDGKSVFDVIGNKEGDNNPA